MNGESSISRDAAKLIAVDLSIALLCFFCSCGPGVGPGFVRAKWTVVVRTRIDRGHSRQPVVPDRFLIYVTSLFVSVWPQPFQNVVTSQVQKWVATRTKETAA